MKATLEAIQFNHQENLASQDAFTIRQNETLTISLPEWKPDQNQNFPAAYACDAIGTNKIIIKAKFTWSDTAVPSIWVQALDGHGNGTNVLGIVPKTEVLKNGTDLVDLTLDNVRLESVSKSDVIWKWQFSLTGAENSWADITTTTHRIYTVLNLPALPWEPLASPQSNNIQIPWTEALEVACKWAAGEGDIDLAAGLITDEVNRLGRSKVIYAGGASFIPENTENFCLTEFLLLVNGSPPEQRTNFNCADCATAVATFANLVGASLSESRMGSNFQYNHIQRIGERFVDGSTFIVHEVAWTGDCTEKDRVFDACLHLDGDDSPQTNPFQPLLAENMPFQKYLLQLTTPGVGLVCKPEPTCKQRRRFGTSQITPQCLSNERLNALRSFYNFAWWENIRLSYEHVFILHSSAERAESLGWKTKTTEILEFPDGVRGIYQTWCSQKKPRRTVRVNAFESKSLADGHQLLLRLLGACEVPLAKREAPRNLLSFGDIAFTNFEGTSVLFARGNLVITVRSEDSSTAKPGSSGRHASYSKQDAKFAELIKQLDTSLLSRPDDDGHKVKPMIRFRFADGEFFVGDLVPLVSANALRDSRTYKFFSEHGEVLVQDQELFYRPAAADRQTLDVYAVDVEGEVRKQRLEIVIEKK